MSRCHVTIYPDRAELRFRLDGDRGQDFHECVGDLKASIPAHARAWEPLNKLWTVDIGYLGRVRDWAFRWFTAAELLIEDEPRRHHAAPSPAPAEDAWSTLWLRPGAPEIVIKAVYRALSLENHPDRGGDHALMVRINSAFEALTKGAA